MTVGYLRSCAGCSAHLLTNDPTSDKVWCATCRPQYVTPFDAWAADLKAGDTVYVQPYVAWRGLSRSPNLVISRDGDEVTIQIIGLPASRQTVNIAHLGQHNLTPRSRTGAL